MTSKRHMTYARSDAPKLHHGETLYASFLPSASGGGGGGGGGVGGTGRSGEVGYGHKINLYVLARKRRKRKYTFIFLQENDHKKIYNDNNNKIK